MTNKSIDGLAASFLIIFSILLGLNQVLVKLVNVGMHPVFQVALRSTLAIFPILIYCYIAKKKINFLMVVFLLELLQVYYLPLNLFFYLLH